MKRLAAPLLMLNAFVLTLGISCLNHRTETPGSEHISPQTTAHGARVFNIGVLIYGHSLSSEAMITQFKRAFYKATGHFCKIDLYDAQQNYMLLTTMATKLLMEPQHDLIWSIGLQAAQVFASIAPKHISTIPILLSNLPWDKIQTLMHEAPLFKKYATGWGGSYNWKRRIHILRTLIPHAKRVLFLYSTARDPSCLDEVKIELDAQGLTHSEVGIDDINTILSYTRNALDNIDVIFVLQDSGILPAIDKLATLGNNYHIPIFASDIISIERGAACGTCADEENAGYYCVWFAREILLRKRKPAGLPFVHVKDWGIKAVLNKKTSALHLQNSRTPENIRFLMEHSVLTQANRNTQRALYGL